MALVLAAGSVRASTTVTLVHFSDYHSHAVPFYDQGAERGGIARAIGFMERQKRAGALVLSGGDMLNRGAPAWSDKYTCAEWPWLNGIVDAMAFGNHDADYGNDELTRCRSLVRYPILSANTSGFERDLVFERNGVRIGVFAIAGGDFPQLVTNAKFTFTDPVSAARDVVQTLRERQNVDAVVMIGHEQAERDYSLAAAVPGIDLILGTHSHLEQGLTRIAGTQTWYISPYQYLAYVSVVKLQFEGHKLTGIEGRLVPVDSSMAPDPAIEERVRTMERELESDPQYRALFVPIARLPQPLGVDQLAGLALDAMRTVTKADVALSTTSTFRQPLPPGTVNLEMLRAALPYDNEIVMANVSGDILQKLLARAGASPASDASAYASLAPPIDPRRTYSVAVTNYMAHVNTTYRDLLAGAKLSSSGILLRDAVMQRLGAMWPPTP